MAKKKTNFSATELLEARNSFIDASMLFKLLGKTGHLNVVEYLSSLGTGEIKTFKSLTDKGLKYGINRGTGHPPKTECRFFEETFDELLSEVSKLVKHERY